MSTPIGVWIDHRRAFLVLLNQVANSITIYSDASRRPAAPGDPDAPSPFGPKDIIPEDRINRRYKQHLEKYYDRVAKALGNCQKIYIIGPGEAKYELKSHLLRDAKGSSLAIELENGDKMTEGQIIARVREHFHH